MSGGMGVECQMKELKPDGQLQKPTKTTLLHLVPLLPSSKISSLVSVTSLEGLEV